MNALERIAAHVAQSTDPRSQHIAATLRQLAGLLPCVLSVAELGAGYETLALRTTLDPKVEARRLTCKELAQVCRALDEPLSSHGCGDALAKCYLMWAQWAGNITGDDPRSVAMRETFLREAHDLMTECEKLGAIDE